MNMPTITPHIKVPIKWYLLYNDSTTKGTSATSKTSGTSPTAGTTASDTWIIT